MAKQYSTVARIFIDKNNHHSFESIYATMGISLISVKTESLNTSNPRFASDYDVTESQNNAQLVNLEFSVNKERLHPNFFNESYSDPEFTINKLTTPSFDECDKFVKAVKRIKSALKRKDPEIEAFRGCVTDYIEKFFEAAKVDTIWFESYNESIGKPRFTTFNKDEIESLVKEAALLLK